MTSTEPASGNSLGIVGKADLPIPVWLFSWAAAIVLVVSFVALSALWMTPQLQEQRLRRLCKLPVVLEWLASLSPEGARARVFVIPTNEELMIARDAFGIVGRPPVVES